MRLESSVCVFKFLSTKLSSLIGRDENGIQDTRILFRIFGPHRSTNRDKIMTKTKHNQGKKPK